MSRIASGVMLCLDLVWLVTVILGIPPSGAYAPVSSMLSACTVATFGAYGINSFGRAFQQTTYTNGPTYNKRPRPNGGEDEKAT